MNKDNSNLLLVINLEVVTKLLIVLIVQVQMEIVHGITKCVTINLILKELIKQIGRLNWETVGTPKTFV